MHPLPRLRQRLAPDPYGDEAADAVPDDFADELALVGPAARIRERYRVFEDAGVRTLKVGTRDPRGLALMAEITGADKGNIG